jgi:hypothetical protein
MNSELEIKSSPLIHVLLTELDRFIGNSHLVKTLAFVNKLGDKKSSRIVLLKLKRWKLKERIGQQIIPVLKCKVVVLVWQ